MRIQKENELIKLCTKLGNYLKGIYDKSVTIHRGKTHAYFRVEMDFSNKGKVHISMIEYLTKMINYYFQVHVLMFYMKGFFLQSNESKI